MDIKIEGRIHNRFDIEVRDARTGELKQKGYAENIVLDRMYERLCNYNSYFDYIHFGTGTGTLDSSRKKLFTPLGYKSATTDQTEKGFPNSKWVRKITLNPEEYVNETLTEVGISDSTSYVNTHALICDAVGNQISITKTDIDVLIIYATVFITLQNKSENIRFTNLPNNNNLLNYLLGGSAPSNTIQVGASYKLNPISCAILITSKAGAKTVDVANRKVLYDVRFGITEGNGEIAEIGLANTLACRLPEPGVFSEYNLQDVLLGVGDGVKTDFAIPNSRVSNLVVRQDGEVTTDFSNIPTLNLRNISMVPQPGSDARGVAFSHDSTYLAVASRNSPYLTVYKRSGDSFTKLDNVPQPDSYAYNSSVAFSHDSIYLAAASESSPYLTVYKRSGDSFTKLDNVPPLSSYTYCVAFSHDSTYLAAVSTSSPYLTVYKRSGDSFEKLDNVPQPSSYTRGVAFSHDSTYLAVGSGNTPYLTVYKRSGDSFEKLDNVPQPGSYSYIFSVAFSHDSTYLAVASEGSPYLAVYKRSGDSFEKLNNVPQPSNVSYSVAFSHDSTYLAVASRNSPYLIVYKRNGDSFTKLDNVPQPGSNARGVTFSHDSTYLAVASADSPYLTAYTSEETKTIIRFNTPPTTEVTITADYKVPYIPKTNDYILDVNIQLQFGS